MQGLRWKNDGRLEGHGKAVAEAPSLEGLLQAQLRYIRHLNRGNYENFKPLGRFGYTMDVVEHLGLLSAGHAGGGPGMSASFEIYPDLGCSVILLSNFDRAARKVAEHIRELLAARQTQ